jgi:hypothetical protein
VKTISAVVALCAAVSLTACRQQKTLVQQPENGTDVFVHEYHPNRNLGKVNKIAVMAWTFKGTPALCRGLIRFDLSSIPRSAKIEKATLRLFHVEDQGIDPQHSSLSGSNAGVIQQVTSSWHKDSVTWNNQPASTQANEVELKQSLTPTQDYAADVTTIVKNMVRNPSTNYGFMIRLQTELYYRALMFASSDHTKKHLHPAIEITYRARK